MTEPKGNLKWTAQLTVADDSSATLQGDKIILPPSALEQLLSAATVVVTSQVSSTYSSPWGPGGGPMQILDRKQDLPHPLTFRIVSPSSGNVVYAGIRQFTAQEGHIEISNFLSQALNLSDGDNAQEVSLTVHFQELPKGSYVKLRPLEAGYDADWKPLLERYMRTNFTSLTKGLILNVPSGDGTDYKFLVDEIKPDDSEAICIVDTDLEVDIEALNEEQARETVKQKAQRSQSGGILRFGQPIQGQVSQDEYVDYTLEEWDRSKDISINLASEGEVDLFLSPLSSRQRKIPRETEHVIASVGEQPRSIELRTTNIELEGAEKLYISVYGLEATSFSVTVEALEAKEHHNSRNTTTDHPNLDETICKNCHQSIPKRTQILHESFCYRNNILCPKCNQVFQKSSPAWAAHWHCPHDSTHGNTAISQDRHHHLSHDPKLCPGCSESFLSVLTLAQHRTTICPAKPILCQFCHLLVPQQGPEDPDFSSAEVLLSGLTPHELTDGARTTECHLCGKFTRLRDMPVHMAHHDLARKSKPTPRICSNTNCGRTIPTSQISQVDSSALGLCSACFAPLYASGYDPEGKALRRRTERRYLTQLLNGCGEDWCRNELCKTAREYKGMEKLSSKDGLAMVKSQLEQIEVTATQKGAVAGTWGWRFCVDEERVQKRRILAEMLVAQEDEGAGKAKGYELGWWVAALEGNANDISKARNWLSDWARRRDE